MKYIINRYLDFLKKKLSDVQSETDLVRCNILFTGQSVRALKTFYSGLLFYKQRQTEIDKKQAKAIKHSEVELLLFEISLLFSSILTSKNYRM